MARPTFAAACAALLLLASSVHAVNPLAQSGAPPPNDFDPKQTYYFIADLQPEFAYNLGGQTDNNAGLFYGTYSGGTLSYKFVHNVGTYTSQGIYGPRTPLTDPTNQFSFASEASTLSYTIQAPQVLQFPNIQGAVIGSWNLDMPTFLMLWAGSLYVQVNTDARPNGTIAGNIYLTSAYVSSSAYFTLDMQGNDGSRFPPPATPFTSSMGTSNTAIGFMYQSDISSNTNTWFIKLYHTASNAGALTVSCPNVGKFSISTTATSPVTAQLTIPNDVSQEMFVPKACNIYLVTGAFPTGELFSYLNNVAPLTVQMIGQNVPVSSSYYASGNFYYDRASQALVGGIKTNITLSTITTIDLYAGTTGTQSQNGPICTLFRQSTGTPAYPKSVACRVNGTSYDDLWNGNTYMMVSTSVYTSGELRAQLSGNVAASAGLSQGAIIGIAVGVSVAVVLIAAIVGVVLFKSSGKSCSTSTSKL